MNEFGNYLQELRGKMSLRQASTLTGISHTYIRDLELGKKTDPSVDILTKLANAYRVPYGQLASKYFTIVLHPKILEDYGPPNKGYSVENDLISLLNIGEITYKGHPLSDEECQRILDMLKVLLPDKQEWKKEVK